MGLVVDETSEDRFKDDDDVTKVKNSGCGNVWKLKFRKIYQCKGPTVSKYKSNEIFFIISGSQIYVQYLLGHKIFCQW